MPFCLLTPFVIIRSRCLVMKQTLQQHVPRLLDLAQATNWPCGLWFVLTGVSVRSPRKVFIFILRTTILRIKVSYTCLIQFRKQNHYLQRASDFSWKRQNIAVCPLHSECISALIWHFMDALIQRICSLYSKSEELLGSHTRYIAFISFIPCPLM